MLNKKREYLESKCKFGLMMPRLLILFTNKKKDTLESLYLYNETKSYYPLKSADPWLA